MKDYIKDSGKSMIIGLVIGGSITFLTGLITLITGTVELSKISETITSALCFVGAIGLFLSAAFILMKKSAVTEEHSSQWKKHFKKINITIVFIIVSFTILIFAGGVDFLRYINR
jgi:SNF family Na+-dependent transporter